jgi:cell wall-associated NlpC family hydrolase
VTPTTKRSWKALADGATQARLGAILRSWERTPYLPGQQCKGVGVDCVRFVCAVLDELLGRKTPIATLPPDTCMHNPARAAAAMERIATLYDAVDATDAAVLLPGDAVVVGPEAGGPGHCLIVGDERGQVWHANPPHVSRVGLGGIYAVGRRVFRVYRLRGAA